VEKSNQTENEFAKQIEFQKIKRRNKIFLILFCFSALIITLLLVDHIISRNNYNKVLVTLDDGIKTGLINITTKNDLIYCNSQKILMENPVIFKPYYDKIMLAQEYSDKMIKYIFNLRSKIIAYTEYGIKERSEDYNKWSIIDTLSLININSKNNSKKPMVILLGSSEDGSKGDGMELEKKLEGYRKNMLNLLEINSSKRYQKNIVLKLDKEVSYSGGEVGNWVTYHFMNNTLLEDVAFLNKLMVDVKSLEGDVIGKLYSCVDTDLFYFSGISSFVIPESDNIPVGSYYKARILLAAFDTLKSPDIYIGDTITHKGKLLDRTNFKNGFGLYTVYCSSPGKKSYTGWITFITPGGTEPTYSNFSGSYIVSDTSSKK
jgi:hypothetical protein